MNHSDHQEPDRSVVLVEPPEGEVERLADEIPEWHLAATDADAICREAGEKTSRKPSGIIVFARKDEEPRALKLCKRLRHMRVYEDVPLLVGISVYQMPLGNDVKRLPKAHFIFTPISKDDLRRRVETLERRAG